VQWQWQANPEATWWSLVEAPGTLRLFPQPLPAEASNLWPVAALLLQKPPAESFCATTELTFEPKLEGERAGLLVFGSDYAWIGITRSRGKRAVVARTSVGASEGRAERTVAVLPAAEGPLRLRVQWWPGGLCRLSVSLDGRDFITLGSPFAARPGRWVGAKVGLFASVPAGKRSSAHADFGFFRVEPLFP
jgi:beta-xylosidase